MTQSKAIISLQKYIRRMENQDTFLSFAFLLNTGIGGYYTINMLQLMIYNVQPSLFFLLGGIFIILMFVVIIHAIKQITTTQVDAINHLRRLTDVN